MFAAPRDDIGGAELTHWQTQRLAQLLREILPANRFYARKFQQAGVDASPLSLPVELAAPALHDQDGVTGRSSPLSALWRNPDLSRRTLQPAASNLRHLGPAAALAGYAGKLVAAARLLGGHASHRRRRTGAIGCSFPSRSGRSLASGRRSRRRRASAVCACPAAA